MLLLRITAQGGQKKNQVPAVMLHNAYLKACDKLLLKSFSQKIISPLNTYFLNKYWPHRFLLPLLFPYRLLPGKTPEWQKFFSH